MSASTSHLIVPVAAASLAEAQSAIDAAVAGGAEAIELRLDLLPAGAEALASRTDLPVIFTCRDKAEGGRAVGDDAARAARLAATRKGLHRDASRVFIDFEFSAWSRCPEARRILADAPLILSAHDFSGTFANLRQLAESIWNSTATVAKIAYKANRITDCFGALDLLHDARNRKPTLALAMGEAGVITRLLARKLGGFGTFAAVAAGQGTAPGQPTLADFKTLYRWGCGSASSQLFGVIGFPVSHSMSPAIHNAAFDAIGADGLYLPLLVEPTADEFDALLDGIIARNDWLNFRGLSVTIPHKENALRYVQCGGDAPGGARGSIEPLACRIGAANTIRFEPDGLLSARNTDYAAVLDSICLGLCCGHAALKGCRVSVLGAGGVSRAAVAGLVDAGAIVTICNRTASRAQALAAEFGCRAVPFDAACTRDADVIVNATSVGMHPKADDSPLSDGAIAVDQLVFDTVYNPVRTRLLQQAAAAGARTVNGVELFVRQAVAQFEFWTGKPAPADAMRRVVLDRLARS